MNYKILCGYLFCHMGFNGATWLKSVLISTQSESITIQIYYMTLC
jgi:hypothetical protein